MSIDILPLAITMMAGPQIMSAIIFVTTDRPIGSSVAFVLAVGVATTLGLAIALGVHDLLGLSLGDPSDSGSTGHIIQYALIGLLVLGALKNWRGRETIEPPKWLGKLMEADWKQALKVGLLVIFLMPSDIIVMFTVATNLAQSGDGLAEALPFIGATTLIAALPLLAFLLFHRRAVRAMPHVRDWMNDNSWLVNILVCGLFIVLIAA